MGFRGAGLTFVASAKDVATDLKLSDDQVKKIETLNKEAGEKRRGLMQPGADREELMQKMRMIGEECEKSLNGILSAEQMVRLKQVSLQVAEKRMGLLAAISPEVQEKLALTDDQKKQMTTLREESGRSFREAMQGGAGGDREGARAKMDELRKGINEKIIGLLTAEQKEKWKQTLGEPFKGEVPMPSFGRGPGGRQEPGRQEPGKPSDK